MNPEEFKKGIQEFREIKLSRTEKAEMLEKIFATPIESPFMNWGEISNFFRKPAIAAYVLASFTLALTSVAYTTELSEPGEALYAIKTAVFEPILDQVNTSPLEKLEWEEEKIDRRIQEAEALAKNNKLDEKKTLELEKKIRKSSTAFAEAAEKVASSTATTTKGRSEKAQALKESFKKKLEEKKDEDEREGELESKEKVKRLKDRAVKALDEKDEDDNSERKDNSGKGNRKDRD